MLNIVIDSAEKYPWSFPGASVMKRKLTVGDYALLIEDRIEAVVERKSFDNLLGEVGALQALRHQLADLASYPVPVLVIEADRTSRAAIGEALNLIAMCPHIGLVLNKARFRFGAVRFGAYYKKYYRAGRRRADGRT